MARDPEERRRLKTLGRAVRKARTEMGLTQEAFGYKAGLDRTYVSGIERGVRNPTVLVLHQVADALEMPLSELVRLAGAEMQSPGTAVP